jgi:hypothetical protein
MAKCDICGERGTDVGWDHMTNWDKAVESSGTRGGHPVHLALLGLSTLAKYACSNVYHCHRCKRYWREWFD